MLNVRIQPATKQDVPLILKFIKELADYEKLLHEVTATEEMLKESLFCDNPRAEVIIAYCDDRAVGFALFFHNFSTFLGKPGIYLEDLYVRPEVRGKGIGKMLLKHLASLAVERDCGRLEWCVLDWNQQAIDFYRSIGAIPIDERTVQRASGDALIALAE